MTTPPKKQGSPDPQFFLWEHGIFGDPGNATRTKFEDLAKSIIKKVEDQTGTSIEASGISDREIWALWKVPQLEQLWSAMNLVNKDVTYAEMQNMIGKESQNFYAVIKTDQDNDGEVGSSYAYYFHQESRVRVQDIPETLSNLNLMLVPAELTFWSVTLQSMTGPLYTFIKLWRVKVPNDGKGPLPDELQLQGGLGTVRKWSPGAYEG